MHILDVIKYEGGNNTLVWKHPAEDFNTVSQLIVHESQEALFFRDGQALDLFGAGRYTLHTQNIPLLGALVKLPFDGVSPFHCEVYFINKTEEMAIRWGTDSRVSFMDPTYGFPMTIGAGGEMTLSVADSRRLVIKLVGTEALLSRDKFVSYMRAIINLKVKPFLSSVMQQGEFTIFDVDAHMEEFSQTLHQMLIPEFADYGIDLRRFMVINVAKPEDDPNYHRLLDLHARQTLDVKEAQIRKQVAVIEAEQDAQVNVIAAEARAEGRRREGYTYQQERGFDVSERVASNAAVGEFSNIGIGMGMIGGIGGSLAGGVSQTVGQAMGAAIDGGIAGAVAAQPPAAAPQQAPAPEPPAPAAADPLEDFKTRVAKLKILRDEGLIDDAEFEAQKARILSEI